MFRNVILFLLLSATIPILAQAPYTELNSPLQQYILRTETTNGRFSNSLHTGLRPYDRASAARWLAEADSLSPADTPVESFNRRQAFSGNIPWSGDALYDSRKPFFRHFYRSRANLYQVHTPGFDLLLNPGIHLLVASDPVNNATYSINSRAVELSGSIGRKLGFYSFISENQIFAAAHELEYRRIWGSYPGAHLTKSFKEGGMDFFQARGYITFTPITGISIQFGQDRNFIGHGIRSLLLSDFATDYPFLKINTKVWKLHYMNLFARLTDRYGYVTGSGSTRPYPAKFIALHYLSLNLLPNLNAGLFESVTFHDNNGDGRSFDFSYLNPIIFYRSVEHQLGDPDKMMVGATLAWLPVKNFKLYGQFMLNEFRLNDLMAGNGHHGNKFGYQAGADYTQVFGLKQLDLKLEYNRVRPYTYTHYAVGSHDTYPVNSYSHYNQPLAHPLGANFSELLIQLNAQPWPRVTASALLTYARYGADSTGSNWGGNIFLDYRHYERELGNTVGQGVATRLLMLQALVSVQVRYNFFVELDLRFRDLNSAIAQRNSQTSFIGASLRYNLNPRLWSF